MVNFFSKTTLGFYVTGIHTDMPEDAVEVSETARRDVLDAQQSGAVIQGDASGRPVAIFPATPTNAELLAALATQARDKRNALLTASDWTQIADATVDQTAWATYRQALRDVPQQDGFPNDVVWPVKP